VSVDVAEGKDHSVKVGNAVADTFYARLCAARRGHHHRRCCSAFVRDSTTVRPLPDR
jgi:hypothetical protein